MGALLVADFMTAAEFYLAALTKLSLRPLPKK